MCLPVTVCIEKGTKVYASKAVATVAHEME